VTCVLGIDGGGTKTVALVADLQGNVLGRGQSGPSNYQILGLDEAVAAIAEAASAAGITGHRCEAACLGLAGVGREEDRALLLPAIESLDLADRVMLEHDAAIALAGATVCQPGVVVLAGTGAMAFGMNQSGERKRSGGWGSILGDEGSAYYISRRALTAACRAYDDRGPETILTSKLMEHLGLDDFTDIVKRIYGKGSSPKEIASFAPLVSHAAKDGDEIAIAILKDAAAELALAVEAVVSGLDMENEAFHVAISGSVFKAGELLIAPFSEHVRATARYSEVISPKFEPAMGAALLALQMVGVKSLPHNNQ
jgi:N-acetylglucosamine kinase